MTHSMAPEQLTFVGLDGEQIRARRESLGMSRADVVRAMNTGGGPQVDVDLVRQWEETPHPRKLAVRGKMVGAPSEEDLQILQRMAQALGAVPRLASALRCESEDLLMSVIYRPSAELGAAGHTGGSDVSL